MAVQLIFKNSSVEDRRPSANQLANGELSLNYNEEGAFVCCRDTAGNVQQLGGVKFSDNPPGDLFMELGGSTQPRQNSMFLTAAIGRKLAVLVVEVERQPLSVVKV